MSTSIVKRLRFVCKKKIGRKYKTVETYNEDGEKILEKKSEPKMFYIFQVIDETKDIKDYGIVFISDNKPFIKTRHIELSDKGDIDDESKISKEDFDARIILRPWNINRNKETKSKGFYVSKICDNASFVVVPEEIKSRTKAKKKYEKEKKKGKDEVKKEELKKEEKKEEPKKEEKKEEPKKEPKKEEESKTDSDDSEE